MTGIAIPLPFRIPAPRQGGPNLGLDNIIYQRVFRPSALDTSKESRAVALTFENNGYLLWVLCQLVNAEGDKTWERESVEFLPPGREDAIDRVVGLAAHWRDVYDAVTTVSAA